MKRQEMNRRSFMKNSLIASTAGVLMPNILKASPERHVKLGFIGVGGRGTGLCRLY